MLTRFLITAALIVVPAIALASSQTDLKSSNVEAEFVKKRYTIHGSAEIETSDGITRIIFSDDFKTKNGPDLKVYLSKIPLTELSEKDVDEDALRVSVLKSHKGSQSYTLPANIDISEYKSVVIQCEAYAVLWGGFDL